MNQNDIKKLLGDVNKKSPNNNIFFTSICMANAYLTYHFKGTEHNILKTEYSDRLFTYILVFLNDSKNLTGEKFNVRVLEKFINDIRKDTYELRKSMLFDWIKGVTEKEKSKNNLVQYLITFFPNLNEISKIREELGLNYVIN